MSDIEILKKAWKEHAFKRIHHRFIELYTTTLSSTEESLFTSNDEILFVVKRVKVDDSIATPIQRATLLEGDIIKHLSHPNIISIYHAQITFREDLKKQQLVACFPFMRGGDLYPYTLNYDGHTPFNLTPTEIFTLMDHLVSAFDYLHNVAHYVHRDIKPENMLLEIRHDMTSVKLCDFGFAVRVKEYGDSFAEKLIDGEGNPGTPHFAAPEIFGDELTTTPKASDCWALGISLFALAEKRYPFTGATTGKIEHAARNYAINYHSFQRTKSFFIPEIIQGFLRKDAKHRLTMKEARTLIESHRPALG
jgi:serine/threonine protein kinase